MFMFNIWLFLGLGDFFFLLMILRLEPRALRMLGECSAPCYALGPFYWYLKKQSSNVTYSAE